MKVEKLSEFQGRRNIRHIISDNGADFFLTQGVSFADEITAKGACKLNTVENDTKHVLFLFNDKNEEVGRYYIGKKLQGKTPGQITELKDNLAFFESYNPKTKKWIPCVGFRKSAQLKVEILSEFQGRRNIRHIISDNGAEIFLTQGVSFADEITAKGACKLNTVENDTKHVLFLFNDKNEEVGRYYIGKKLQGKTPGQITELKDNLAFFESYNPKTKKWVPFVGFRKSAQLVQPYMENAINQVSPNQKDAINDATTGVNTNEYTEEMFKQELADQEEKMLLEYGTTDEKKIEQIKKDRKDNRNVWIFIIIIGVVMYMFMGLIAKCTGSKFDPFEDNDTEWQYKHTDRHY